MSAGSGSYGADGAPGGRVARRIACAGRRPPSGGASERRSVGRGPRARDSACSTWAAARAACSSAARRASSGARPFGVDLNQDLLRNAKPAGHVARADGATLPFRDGAFDFVLVPTGAAPHPGPGEAACRGRPRGAHGRRRVRGRRRRGGDSPSIPSRRPGRRSRRRSAASATRRGGDPFVGRQAPQAAARGRPGRPHAPSALPVTTDDRRAARPSSRRSWRRRRASSTRICSTAPRCRAPGPSSRNGRRDGERIRLRSRVDGWREETGWLGAPRSPMS